MSTNNNNHQDAINDASEAAAVWTAVQVLVNSHNSNEIIINYIDIVDNNFMEQLQQLDQHIHAEDAENNQEPHMEADSKEHK
jgi:hypothetical protein